MTNSDAGDSTSGLPGRGVANVVTGSKVRTVVQAGVIHGGVHVHQHAQQVVPHQLRPRPAHFTGRHMELVEMNRAIGCGLEQDRPALLVISGPGGVGKSALALHWLHGTLEQYPDGQLYADLGPETSAGSELLTVLGQFLRALGVAAERVPADAGEAAALFRSVTAQKRIALLIDNVTSAAQVRAMLPALSPMSVVVATTRWRLGGLAMDGANFVPLAPLEISTGIELLARAIGNIRVSHEPDAVARLVELCAGLPIALVIAGARLAMRPRWPIARVIHDLDDERRRLPALSIERDISVQGVFDVSYQGLAEPVARAYRWLGLHPGKDFRAEVAAAALETHPEETEELLETLVDANLLDDNETGRYRFHDLVRLHARQCAERADPARIRAAVVRRIAEHYLYVSSAADIVVIPMEWRLGPAFRRHCDAASPAYSTGVAALDSLEVELPNLMATLRASVELGFDELVWQLCESMFSVFLYRRNFSDWLVTYQLGIEAAGRCGNQAAKSRMHHHLGMAFHTLGRSDEALHEGTAALAAARAAQVREAESEAMDLIGMANRAQGRYDEAIDILRQAVVLDREAGLPRNEVLGRRLLGQTFMAAGRLDEAIAELAEARQQAAPLSDAHVEANVMVWLADALTRAGRAGEAVSIIKDAWSALSESGSLRYCAQVLMVWGEAATQLDDLENARDYLTRSRDLYAEIGAPHLTRVQGLLDTVEACLAEAGG